MSKSEIRKMMVAIMNWPSDVPTNATRLAEETAWALCHDEWLDDEHHDVWEIALEFFD